MKEDEADSVILVWGGMGKEREDGRGRGRGREANLVQPVLAFHVYTGSGDQTRVLLLA